MLGGIRPNWSSVSCHETTPEHAGRHTNEAEISSTFLFLYVTDPCSR